MKTVIDTWIYRIKNNECKFSIYEYDDSTFYGRIFYPIGNIKYEKFKDNQVGQLKTGNKNGELLTKDQKSKEETLEIIINALGVSEYDVEGY